MLSSQSPGKGTPKEVSPDLICVAVVVGPHGIQGSVKVKSFSPESQLDHHSIFFLPEGGVVEVMRRKPVGKGLLAFDLKGIKDRAGAESLQGALLYVRRKDLPSLEENEFLHKDLLGMEGQTPSGDTIGKVVAVYNFGAGDILEFLTSEGGRVTVPFTQEAVPVVDLKAQKIQVDWPILEEKKKRKQEKDTVSSPPGDDSVS
jgi:16S rRNA processing protein RimM